MSPSFTIRRKPIPTGGEAAESAPFLTRADTNKPLPRLPVQETAQSSSQASTPEVSNTGTYREPVPAIRTGKDVVKAAGLRKRLTPTRVLPCGIDYQSTHEGSAGSNSSSGKSQKDMFISLSCYFGSYGDTASPALWSMPVHKELADPRYRIMLDRKWRRVMPVPPPGLFFTKW
ncbi:hypothetical protein DL98DRAFT_579782 [Cadophora sp. DSE1049]|nr:hypothetical protein DL98DRAFT_579782 [Cadophora sp. DSE1049]